MGYVGMGGMGWSLIGAALLIIPFWKIYDKTGVDKVWLLALLVPVPGYFLVWLALAASAWPNARQEDDHGNI